MTAAEQHHVMNGGFISIRNCPSVPSAWDASHERRRYSDCRFDAPIYKHDDELADWVQANRLRWLRDENEEKRPAKDKKNLTPFERELMEARIEMLRIPEDPSTRAARDKKRLRAVINSDEDLLELSLRLDIKYLFR